MLRGHGMKCRDWRQVMLDENWKSKIRSGNNKGLIHIYIRLNSYPDQHDSTSFHYSKQF